VSDSNHIILVGEQSSIKPKESCESENQDLPNNSILRETRSTDNKSIMPRRSQSLQSVRSDDKILKKFEAAKKLEQKKGEINAAIRSLKTNLTLCFILIMTFLLMPVLNPTFGNIMISFMKGFVPILTTISNFGKIKKLISSYWNNLFKSEEN
jgi:hypothetical protein